MAMTTDKARTSGWLAAGLALMVTAAVAAQSTTVRGTVEQVDKARVEVAAVDDHGKPAGKPAWYAVTDATKVTRAGKAVAWADALRERCAAWFGGAPFVRGGAAGWCAGAPPREGPARRPACGATGGDSNEGPVPCRRFRPDSQGTVRLGATGTDASPARAPNPKRFNAMLAVLMPLSRLCDWTGIGATCRKTMSACSAHR